MVDTYGTAELLGVTEKKTKFVPLFLNLFYPFMHTSDKEEIKLDELDDDTDIAVVVSPMESGKIIASQGYSTNTFKAAYVKPKHEVDVTQLQKRRAGERLTGELNMAQRRNAAIAENVLNEEKAIAQYEEKQAVDGILYGGYVVEGEGYPAQHVSFNQRPENRIVLGPGERWTEQDPETYDPTPDIEEYCQASDGVISLMLMDGKAWTLFTRFKKVQEKLDTRRGSTSTLETALKDLGEVVSFKGWFGDVAIIVTRHYYTENKQKKRYMPPFTILFGNSSGNRGTRAYGAIKDLKAIRENNHITDRFPKNWEEEGDPAREFTMTQSSPLMVPLNIHDFVVLVVGQE